MVRIADARMDENKKAKGGAAGDQTGFEIAVRDWYLRDGGWDVYLECIDPVMAYLAARKFIQIANDNSFGYDQDQRWTGLDAIKQAGGDIASAADSEFDCSSVIDTIFILCGLKVERGYTGNLERRYLATGKFIAHREPKYLNSGNYAKVGGLYLAAGKHVAMIVSNSAVQPPDDDSVQVPYVKIISKVNVRAAAGSSIKVVDASNNKKKVYNGKVIYTARDENLKYITTDPVTGWYQVMCPNGVGYVSNEIPRYAKLIKE